ncbi:IS200/IS605 family transposase [Bacteroides fragilis]|nr:IS200/IS605 family transposase [Bacteroides fragilis]
MAATKDRYTTNSHCIFNISYHLIWCPKYRRKVLVNGIDDRLKELLQEKAQDLGVTIEKMEVMPDHVHLFVKSTPGIAVQHLVNQLKGYTSTALRKEFPALKRKLPSLWSRSYYCETIGHISEATIVKYIEDQKGV